MHRERNGAPVLVDLTALFTMQSRVAVSLGLAVVLGWCGESLGHGRLVEPPGRSSAWRFGFNTPINERDNDLNCGGLKVTCFY